MGTPSMLAGVMLRTYGTVLLGMNPQRNRSTYPSKVYLLGLMITTCSGAAMGPSPCVIRGWAGGEETPNRHRHPMSPVLANAAMAALLRQEPFIEDLATNGSS
jgi:hypothetical protein